LNFYYITNLLHLSHHSLYLFLSQGIDRVHECVQRSFSNVDLGGFTIQGYLTLNLNVLKREKESEGKSNKT
jgi:hypothetical protein